jgi:hypothetical protein
VVAAAIEAAIGEVAIGEAAIEAATEVPAEWDSAAVSCAPAGASSGPACDGSCQWPASISTASRSYPPQLKGRSQLVRGQREYLRGLPRAPPRSVLLNEFECTYRVEESALQQVALDLIAVPSLVEDAVHDALPLLVTIDLAEFLDDRVSQSNLHSLRSLYQLITTIRYLQVDSAEVVADCH